MALFEALEQSKFVGAKESLIVEILETQNCRVGEVLQARWINYYPNKFLILNGLKRSRNVIVRDRSLLLKIDKLPRDLSEFIFYPVKYRRIYELCKKILNKKTRDFMKKKNEKVTHYFRYENVRPLDNDKIIQDVLYHNSARTSSFYKTKSKGDSNEK